jgi:Ca-activated chloride channel family protein
MFRFEHPDYLYFLGLIPFLLFMAVWASYARQQKLKKIGHPESIKRLMPDWSLRRLRSKNALFLIGLFFLIVAWANPQWGSKTRAITRRSMDLFIALDVSQSMMCQDIAPNRLIQAQKLAERLVEKMADNRVGVVIFAGDAYLQVPLTSDHEAVRLSIQSAHPDMVSYQGTAIDRAVDAALSGSGKDPGNRVMVLLSDGEDHEQAAENKVRQAARDGLKLFCIGVGSAKGGYVPFEAEDGFVDYKRQRNGEPVVSKINEAMLRKLAQAGQGNFYTLDGNHDAVLSSLLDKLSKVKKRDREQRVVTDYQSHFQLFLAIALLFFLAEFLLQARKPVSKTSKT